jgi:Tfp pilus assembly protein PilO
MNLTKREKIAIITFLGVLIFALYYRYFYKPLNQEIEAMSTHMEEEKEALPLHKMKGEKIKDLKEDVTRLDSEISNVLNTLPSADDQPGLIVHLNNTLGKLALRKSMEIQEPLNGSEFVSVPILISMETSYRELKQILILLEQSPYKNRIESLTVQASGMESKVNVDMLMMFYFKHGSNEKTPDYPFMEGGFGKEDLFK